MKLWCIRGLNAFVTLFLEVLDLPLDATNIYTLVIKHGNGKMCWKLRFHWEILEISSKHGELSIAMFD